MLIRISCVALSLLASYQATSSQDQLTPKQIADKIEDVAARYQSIQYSTISNKTRVANPFKQQKDPKLITGNGRTSYKRLGDKWVVDVQSFTVSMPSGQKSRIHTGGGFDGAVHWHRDSNSVTIGEEFSGASLHDPTELLWHGARTRGWLLTALRDKSAKVVGKEEIEGHECLRIESAFRDYRFRFSIAPTAGFLPIRSEVAFKGKVQGVEKLSQLRQSNEGLWYPRRIRIEHPDRPIPFVVQRISLRGFESSKESSDDAFQVPRPVGENIVDRRSGIVFHNDPWWPDLEKKLQTDFDWPVPDLNSLHELSSYGAESGGKPAPRVAAAEWMHGDPGDWGRKDRKVTVVYFFGGRAIRPTPERFASLRRLKEIYGPFGLDIVGVAAATEDSSVVKSAMKMLDVSFPVAIDSKGEGQWGKTYDAFGLGPYTGVFVVDSKAVVHTIESVGMRFDKPSELESAVRKLLTASGAKDLPKVVAPQEQKIGAKFRDIVSVWKDVVAASSGTSTISGVVSSGYTAKGPIPLAGATIEIEPLLKMLNGNMVNSYITGRDRGRKQLVETDKDGRFKIDNLPKGYYTIVATANGRAFDKQEILVGDGANVEHNAELPVEHTIVGRVVGSDDKLSIEDAVIKIVGRHPDPDKPDLVSRSFPQPTAQPDAEGTFTFEYLQSGAYILEVSADGYKTRELKMIPLSKKELVIELDSK